MIEYETFTYWFEYDSKDSYRILDRNTSQVIGHITPSGEMDIETPSSLIQTNFESFKTRPEYTVGRPVEVNGASFDLCRDEYINLLTGLMMIRAREADQDPDKHLDYIQRIVDWVANTDFYEAPASTIYHENFPHGLLYHTLTVYNNMVDLIQIPKFENCNIAGATLAALTHDWCKIGLYESYKRNVKNEQTGQWEKVDAYKRGNFPHPLGHGAASMYMVMKSFKISEEEALAIRWHMSRWNVSENEQNEYQQACEDYPLVHLIQFADQLAITNY